MVVEHQNSLFSEIGMESNWRNNRFAWTDWWNLVGPIDAQKTYTVERADCYGEGGFSDISQYSREVQWAICSLRDLDVFASNERFEGDRPLLRQEMFKVISKLNKLVYGRYTKQHTVSEFPEIADLNKAAPWSHEYIFELLTKNVIDGEAISRDRIQVNPQDNSSYIEFAKMVINTFRGSGLLRLQASEGTNVHWGCQYYACINNRGNGWHLNGRYRELFGSSGIDSQCSRFTVEDTFDRDINRVEVAMLISNALELWNYSRSIQKYTIASCLAPEFSQ